MTPKIKRVLFRIGLAAGTATIALMLLGAPGGGKH